MMKVLIVDDNVEMRRQAFSAKPNPSLKTRKE